MLRLRQITFLAVRSVYGIIAFVGAVVQRIGHIPSKDTMLVRFQPALPNPEENNQRLLSSGFLYTSRLDENQQSEPSRDREKISSLLKIFRGDADEKSGVARRIPTCPTKSRRKQPKVALFWIFCSTPFL